jgi:hypothetical protein
MRRTVLGSFVGYGAIGLVLISIWELCLRVTVNCIVFFQICSYLWPCFLS